MKTNISILLFFALSFATSHLSAQTDTVINGKRYKMIEEKNDTVVKTVTVTKKKKHIAPIDSTFILKNKKLNYYNNWLTVGGGFNQNLTYRRKIGFAGGLDFNFHLKQHYFQLGTMITGERFGFYDNYEFHLGYGKRFEDKDIHFAGFIGVSYSTGYTKNDSVYTNPFNEPGIYVQLEGIKKVTYDVGAGFALFVDGNQEQAIFGAKFIVYFSGAYRGKKYNDGKNVD